MKVEEGIMMDLEPWMCEVMDEADNMGKREADLKIVEKHFKEHHRTSFFYNEFVVACRACDVNPSQFSLRDVEALRKRLKED